jgi:RNase adapter protein RapZ
MGCSKNSRGMTVMEPKGKSTQCLRIVLISGLSGAGKTLALKTLEDLEYFAIDNLPSSLLDPLILLLEQQQEISRVALVMDGRDRTFLTAAETIMESLTERGHRVTLLFLEADREVLIRRFAETRRPHPLARKSPIEDGVDQEKTLLAPLRTLATRTLDTSGFNVHQLRNVLVSTVEKDPGSSLNVLVASFGFKYGVPLEAAFVFDVRYLPNPFFVDDLRHLTGTDKGVSDYVLGHTDARIMVEKITDMARTIIPLCEREGRSTLMLAVGCTGGQHRSVAIAEETARLLRSKGLRLAVVHRDKERAQAAGNPK